MSLVEFKNVDKSFDGIKILKNVSFSIEKGKIIGLLGKNGMGKSTIIKLINDLLTPTNGEVLINGIKPGVESKKIISYFEDLEVSQYRVNKGETDASSGKLIIEFASNKVLSGN